MRIAAALLLLTAAILGTAANDPTVAHQPMPLAAALAQ